MRSVAVPFRLWIVAAALVLGATSLTAAATASGVDPVPFGRPFPPATFDNLNVEAGGSPRIDDAFRSSSPLSW